MAHKKDQDDGRTDGRQEGRNERPDARPRPQTPLPHEHFEGTRGGVHELLGRHDDETEAREPNYLERQSRAERAAEEALKAAERWSGEGDFFFDAKGAVPDALRPGSLRRQELENAHNNRLDAIRADLRRCPEGEERVREFDERLKRWSEKFLARREREVAAERERDELARHEFRNIRNGRDLRRAIINTDLAKTPLAPALKTAALRLIAFKKQRQWKRPGGFAQFARNILSGDFTVPNDFEPEWDEVLDMALDRLSRKKSFTAKEAIEAIEAVAAGWPAAERRKVA